MAENLFSNIYVTGDNITAKSLIVCLLQAGHHVYWNVRDKEVSHEAMQDYLTMALINNMPDNRLKIVAANEIVSADMQLAIIVCREDKAEKEEKLRKAVSCVSENIPILINSESIHLQELQLNLVSKERLFIANWTYPAYTTYFLELIGNEYSNTDLIRKVAAFAVHWKKDPYVLENGIPVRSRLLGALTREAFHLVDNKYATVEDIDRSCRNDAGYYLPFAGNCRYMDLMGTCAYGIVMKDLNKELSAAETVSPTMEAMVSAGHTGMQAQKGFYKYTEKEVMEWQQKIHTFCREIQQLIGKYPFAASIIDKPVSINV